MADNADHMHRLDEATMRLPNATAEQWDAATRYVTQHAPDCLAALGMGGAS